MSSLRSVRWWAWVHKWSSVACTVPLLLLCLTGLPLIFSDEIEEAYQERTLLPALSGQEQPVSIDGLVQAARQRYPREVVRFVFIDDEEPVAKVVMAPADSPNRKLDHRIEFSLRDGSLLKDGLSEAGQAMGLMRTVTTLHTELFAGSVGEYLLAVVGLLFAVATISGVMVYAPFARRPGFGGVRGGSARLGWLDRHNFIGICTLVWALVVGVTGVFNELSKPLFAYWRGAQMSSLLAGYRGLPAVASPGSAQAAYDEVRRALPQRNVTSIIFPSRSFSNPHHFLIWTNGNSPLTRRLFTAALVDARNGALTAVADMPLYLRVLQISRPLHFGDYGGLPLKVFWALLDVALIVLLASGLYLWLAPRARRNPVAHRPG